MSSGMQVGAIPGLDAVTGHLPPGRHRCTLTEVRDRFVSAPDMQASPSRTVIWSGLAAYLGAWQAAQTDLAEHLGEAQLVKALWLAGGFISAAPDPTNADLTLFVDGEAVDLVKGKPGAGVIRRLSDRDDMLARFNVSACVVRYRYVASPFRLQSLGGSVELDYLASRGAFDDFWQRARAIGVPKEAPTPETSQWQRGYLEVSA